MPQEVGDAHECRKWVNHRWVCPETMKRFTFLASDIADLYLTTHPFTNQKIFAVRCVCGKPVYFKYETGKGFSYTLEWRPYHNHISCDE